MWLMEGTAALFEHLYINEFWAGLDRDGVSAAVRHSHALLARAGAGEGGGPFGRQKEDYSSVSMNYFVET